MTGPIEEIDTDGRVIAEWHADPIQAAEWAVAPETLAEDAPELPADPPRLGDLPPDAPIIDHVRMYLARGFEIMPRILGHDGRLRDALFGSPRTGFLRWDECREHWSRRPEHQPAAVLGPTSGVFVIDVDNHGPVDGRVSLAALEAEHGYLPPTPTAFSPTGGGRHLYFRWPDRPIKSGAIAPGVEVLADRAAANLPPARKGAGPYRWSLNRHIDWLPLARAPEWLLELAAPPPPPEPKNVARGNVFRSDSDRYVQAAIRGELAEFQRVAAPGHRNAPLNKAAFNLARFVGEGAITTDELTETLVSAAVVAGHNQRDAQQTVAGAIRRGAAR